MKVLIADGSTTERARLIRMVTSVPEADIVGVAANAEDALMLARQIAVDVVILDSELPGGSALGVLQRVKISNPSALTIVLSQHGDDFLRRQSEALGVDFFFDKTLEFEKAVAVCGLLVADIMLESQFGRRSLVPEVIACPA